MNSTTTIAVFGQISLETEQELSSYFVKAYDKEEQESLLGQASVNDKGEFMLAFSLAPLAEAEQDHLRLKFRVFDQKGQEVGGTHAKLITVGQETLHAEYLQKQQIHFLVLNVGEIKLQKGKYTARFDNDAVPLFQQVQTEKVQYSLGDQPDQPDQSDAACYIPHKVELVSPNTEDTDDQALWEEIRLRTESISFNNYETFIDHVFQTEGAYGDQHLSQLVKELSQGQGQVQSKLVGRGSVDAYTLLKEATNAFLLVNTCPEPCREELGGVNGDPSFPKADLIARDDNDLRLNWNSRSKDFTRTLGDYVMQYRNTQVMPYIGQIASKFKHNVKSNPFSTHMLQQNTMVSSGISLTELIWSYYHEEGMLVQAMNAISLRFQNKRSGKGETDPLANMEIDPLRPMSNMLWGYVQDEPQRLTVQRRAYEYMHQYGLPLIGKAVPKLNPADVRSKFLSAFHSLLNQCVSFYRDDSNKTIEADGFDMLNSLKEVHMIMAEGAHNQYGDINWVARTEMMMQQYLVSRPEMRQFLGGRTMVPYKENWMGQLDTMKKLQHWNDTQVTHFRDLGVFGEQLLLSIRFNNWSQVHEQHRAVNWAKYWKPEIQNYIHAYKTITGVDLSMAGELDHQPPSFHLNRQLQKMA